MRDADQDVAERFLRPVDCVTVPDPDDRFEREPLVARFQAGGFDVRLVSVHIKPDDAFDELAALSEVAEAIADSTEGDVILLGDFNADCSYLNESDATHPLRAGAYHWVIENSVETAVISTPHFPVFAEFRITGPDDDGPGGRWRSRPLLGLSSWPRARGSSITEPGAMRRGDCRRRT